MTDNDPADDTVITVTEGEFRNAALARLGLTYAELEDQVRRRDFISAQAHSLWVSIGDTIPCAPRPSRPWTCRAR
ncbi:hypothetical protein ACFYPT_35815 [Streptomyces sp. NPDC005529]|uniref:hypothetical protein n=1 Tax=unclassified Streptomyces TaxID=2593676 RepID=UPI0033B5489D